MATNSTHNLVIALNSNLTHPAESQQDAKEVIAVLIAEAPKWAIIAGSLAPIVTTLLRLSPVPTVISFCRKGSVGSLPLMPYTALLSDGLLWLFFGTLLHDSRLMITHIFGVSLALTYSICYAKTYTSCGRTDDLTILPGTLKQHAYFIFIISVISVIIMLTVSNHYAQKIIGLGADMGSLFMYAGPLAALRSVFREKNASSLPLPFTLACLMNGFCWFAYGWFVIKEILLWGPSIIGLGLASFQMALICWFGNKDISSKEYDPPLETEYELRKLGPSKSHDSDLDVRKGDDGDDGDDDHEIGKLLS